MVVGHDTQTWGRSDLSMDGEREAVERRCTLSVHDENTFSGQDIVLNLQLFPPGNPLPGDLIAIKSDVAGRDRDTQGRASTLRRSQDSYVGTSYVNSLAESHLARETPSQDVHQAQDDEKQYVFVVKDMTSDQRTKNPRLEISVAKHIAIAFDFKNQSTVLLSSASVSTHVASHVELSFKDQYLARSDMWRLVISELSNKTVYRGQKIVFLGSVKCVVTTVYVSGNKVSSAFFSTDTKPIFRSESARYVLFVQMSREMWDFDSEGSGEIMFSKVVNGFLPALFRRWVALKARHLVSIVLFTRVEYDTGITNELDASIAESAFYTGVQPGSRRPYKDFYRVVVSEMASGEWTDILHSLKREFRFFRHNVSTHRVNKVYPNPREQRYTGPGSIPGTTVEAEPCLACHGNILEAISLASTQFSRDYVDRDLVRTGVSIIVISPGSGLFEVEYEALKSTTENLVNSGIGIDLVCLPKMPLHAVPLFRYRNPQYTQYQINQQSTPFSDVGSTPRQTTAVFGSYTSHHSISPLKHALSIKPATQSPITQKNTFTSSTSSKRKTPDEYCYAIPHWLDASFWTGASEDMAATTEDGSRHQKARSVIKRFAPFPVRCKMYELEMDSSLAGTSEVSIPEIWPRLQVSNLNRESTEIVDGYAYIKSKKHTNQWNFSTKSSRPIGNAQLPSSLDVYDKEAASHPSLMPKKSTETIRTTNKLPARQIVTKTSAEGVSSLGTSFNSLKNNSGMSLAAAAIAKRKNQSSDGHLKERKDSFSSVRSTTTLAPKTSSRPGISRHVSLMPRGFGLRVAAPKTSTAEVTVDVSTAMATAQPAQRVASGMLAKELLSAANDRTSERHSNSSGVSSARTSPSIHPVDSTPNKGSSTVRPIAIRSASTQHTGSLLSNTLVPVENTRNTDVKGNRELAERLSMDHLKNVDQRKLINAKLLSGETTRAPNTLSPTTALSAWLDVLNPSNPRETDDNSASQYRRWQHIYPKPNRVRAIKWKSLCSPASVPLTTEYFPSRTQLDNEYEQKTYIVTQDTEDTPKIVPKSQEHFFRELIGLRLSQGFQIVIGSAVAAAFGQKTLKIADPFATDDITKHGSSVFMSFGNSIHQLSCVNGSDVEIQVFSRRVGTPIGSGGCVYKPGIKTTLDIDYESRAIELNTPSENFQWRTADRYLAGYESSMEQLRYWRARFVLIPVEFQQEQQRTQNRRLGEDTEEEVRLEGIKVLTNMWQRHRYDPADDAQKLANLSTKRVQHSNPLDIVYRTQDPSQVVTAEMENLPLDDSGESIIGGRRNNLLSNDEPFRKSKLDLAELAEAIQRPPERGGVRMQNRRWHFRIHYNCFIGSDMTTWIFENFDDILTREDAVELGNKLMVREDGRVRMSDGTEEKGKSNGLFVHVEKRHTFRDGQYFYQIAADYSLNKTNDRSVFGFGKPRKDVSIPSTPLVESPYRESKPASIARVNSGSAIESDPFNHHSVSNTATNSAPRRPKFYLSKVMKYNVDPTKKSYRDEIINLHFDRLHNPDSCYHIRLDWLNVTSRLIEDVIQSWAKTAERYKLRLIEVPIAEACAITQVHPFRSPYLLKLEVPPPDAVPPTMFDSVTLGPPSSAAKHFYQKAILKKFDFVLDIEAASNFPSSVDVTYSWGKSDYRYSQYIHRSGIGLCQITDEGDFLLLANKLYNNRAVASRDDARYVKNDHIDLNTIRVASGGMPVHGTHQTPISTPMLAARDTTTVPSPVIRPLTGLVAAHADVFPTSRPAGSVTPGAILKDLIAFCTDKVRLAEFYEETLEKADAPLATPRHKSSIHSDHTLDMNIPNFGLGPSLMYGKEAGVGGSSVGLASPNPMRFMGLGSPLPAIRRQSTHPSDAGSGRSGSVQGSPRGLGAREEHR